MKTIFVQAIMAILLVANCSAIDTTSTKYLPLKVGNQWVYEYNSPEPPPNGTHYRFKCTLTRDTLINGHRYYCIYNTSSYIFFDTLNWYRFDSANGNLLAFKRGSQCRPGSDELVDSLASDTNTVAKVCTNGQYLRRCYSAGFTSLFSQQVYFKFFDSYPPAWGGSNKKYAMNFGIMYVFSVESHEYTIQLVGCVLNGTKYGDTTIIGVQKISSHVPNSFSLYQNYPNPFNPVTKIRFDIPPSLNGEGGRSTTLRVVRLVEGVRLIIYDLLGREVSTLVNEELKPGTYEVDWNGSNFASGVYFYSLTAGDPSLRSGQGFTQTKKLILLK